MSEQKRWCPETRSRDGTTTTVIGWRTSQGKAATLSGEAVCCMKSRPEARRNRKSTLNSSGAAMTSRYSPCRWAVTSHGTPRTSPNAADAADIDDVCASLKPNRHKHLLNVRSESQVRSVRISHYSSLFVILKPGFHSNARNTRKVLRNEKYASKIKSVQETQQTQENYTSKKKQKYASASHATDASGPWARKHNDSIDFIFARNASRAYVACVWMETGLKSRSPSLRNIILSL